MRNSSGTIGWRWAIVGQLAIGILLVGACKGDDPEAEAVGAVQGPKVDSIVVMDSSSVRLAGIELVEVAPVLTNRLVANGTIAFDEDQAAIVAPRTEGRIVRVMADLGTAVKAGQVLAVLESPDVAATRADLASAEARLEVARRNHEREQALFRDKISSERETLEAEGAYRVALADFNGASSRLASLGADRGEGATYSILSPLGGVVVERSARPGELAGPANNLFTVADLSRVWITTDIYETDLPRVRRGALATVEPTGLVGRRFSGRVTYAGGVIDPTSRTFKVRVEVANNGFDLRPGMYGTVAIETPAGPADDLEVPEIAVQDLNDKQVVFVATGEPGRFIVREVVVGTGASEGRVAIRSGLVAGERVVGNGAFQLKAEILKASFAEEE